MTQELPEPMVPADVDLRGLEYMPFFGNHLFGSEFNARCTDAEWRAGVTLWWAAWNQVPAGSLPDDDAALARLADLGRDVKGWRKVKDRALHGFVLCSDGRLYHRFIAKQALVAWEKRVKEREKKRKWREAKDRDKQPEEPGQRPGQSPQETGTDTGTQGGTERLTGRDVTGRDDKTLGSKERSSMETYPHAPPDAPRFPQTVVGEASEPTKIAVLLRAQGVPDANGANPVIQGWASSGIPHSTLLQAVVIAREQRGKERPGLRYLAPIVTDLMTEAQRPDKPSQTTLAMQNLQAMKANLR